MVPTFMCSLLRTNFCFTSNARSQATDEKKKEQTRTSRQERRSSEEPRRGRALGSRASNHTHTADGGSEVSSGNLEHACIRQTVSLLCTRTEAELRSRRKDTMQICQTLDDKHSGRTNAPARQVCLLLDDTKRRNAQGARAHCQSANRRKQPSLHHNAVTALQRLSTCSIRATRCQ